MAEPQVAAYGSWTSPITTDPIVTETIGLGRIVLDGGDTYWAEARPSEAGRNIIVKRTPSGDTFDVTPSQFSVNTTYITFEGEYYGFQQSENIKRALEAELFFYSRVFGFELGDPVEPVHIENKW